MDKRVLVSAAGGDIGQAVCKCLHEAGMTVVGCDARSCSPLHGQVHTVPPASAEEDYLAAVKELLEQRGLQFFLPVSEPEILVIDKNRPAFASTHVAVNSPRVIEVFSDKYSTVRFLDSLGIQVPRTLTLKECADQPPFPFPFVVKSRRGCGSKALWIAEDELDFEYLVRKDQGGLIAQEAVGLVDEEYTTGVFSDGTRVDSITFRRRLGLGGLTTEAELEDTPELSEMARTIASAVQLRGSINIQTRKVGNVFVPFEVNPRLSSTLPIRARFGFNDAAWWIGMLCNEGYSYTPRYASGRAYRYLSEIFVDLEPSDSD